MYHFLILKLGYKAAEASRNINVVFGEKMTNERTLQCWFHKFREEDETLEDTKDDHQ